MNIKKIILTTIIIITLIIGLSYIFYSQYAFIKSVNKQCFVKKDFNGEIGDIVYIENKDQSQRYLATILAKPGDKFNFDIANKVFTINNENVDVSFEKSENSYMFLKKMQGDLPENTYLVYPENIDMTFNVFLTKMYIEKKYIVAKNIYCF
jgi:hypothetical protein